AIREELAPGTLLVAQSLNSLGILARRRGDLASSEEYLSRGEELRRRLAPESFDHARSLMNLGNLANDRGDLAKAESLQRRALAIFEKIDPQNGIVADCMQNLVNLAIQRGDLAAADDLLRRMLVLRDGEASGWKAWSTLITLGNLAMIRNDLEAAEVYYRRALPFSEELAPRDVALSLGRLGELALQKGDFATVRNWLRRAQEIEERLAPGSVNVAVGLEYLARLEIDGGGDLAEAERLLRWALALLETKAPESLETASVLRHLGEIASRRGRPREAIGLHRRALALQSRLAPGSTEEGEELYRLGRAERTAGQSREGIRNLCRAIDVLDRQRARLGGTPETKTTFEAALGDYYLACLEGLLDLGRPGEAFHILERGRARSFLALLAERDLRLRDLPPELAAERRRVHTEYDDVVSRLAPLSAGRDDAEIERLTGELRELRARQEEILERIRRESPRSAILHDPQPLDLAGARAALDPGTVLLEYAVGGERTWLFAVQPEAAGGSGLAVFQVAVDAKKLRQEVEGFRLLLKDPGSSPA
ncbi:MAG: tetratricopeptide repeat protein, partial [Thermoanaerobaculia bacterium]